MSSCRRYTVAVALTAGWLLSPLPAAGAQDEEQRLVAVLRSDKPAQEKGAACSRLKRIGTARCVPALAGLLGDEALSHSARYALESIPAGEAGRALCDALPVTKGRLRAGIIDSLGDRREARAVGALAKLLADPDTMAASGAATALGKIGGPEALRALRAVLSKAPAGVRGAAADGVLLCADRLRAGGDAKAAADVYRSLYQARQAAHVRTAAYRGMVLSAGERGVELIASALTGKDQPARRAALQLAGEVPGPAATKALAGLLAKVGPAVQAALIEALAQRGDRAAAGAVAAAVGSDSPAVRAAAIGALGKLGDASCAALLAEVAGRAKGSEQRAARQALARLRGADVARALIDQLPKASPAGQMAIVRALGDRRETSAVPALLKMAAEADESARVAAVRAIAVLGDEASAAKLLALLLAAKSGPVGEALEGALVSIAGRSKRPAALAARVLAARKGASPATRCSLLRVAGRIGGGEALAALRGAAKDADESVRDAAVRTLAAAGGIEAAADLLALAAKAPDPTHRVLALRGYWRVLAAAGGAPAEKRLEMCRAGLAVCRRAEDKKLALAELAKVPHPAALKLAESLRADAAVRGEAETACVRIAAALGATRPAEAKAALGRIASGAASAAARDEARKALDAMQRYVGYVTAWQVAGPFRQKGKECSQLFDIAFPPEQPGGKVAWKPAPRPGGASPWWQLDLASVVGGNHCVVYARSRVHAPAGRAVRLDIGTDDGVKLWLNGKCVHANNAIRGLTPDQDKARAAVKQGANEMLLKITQHTAGCAACVRIRGADGSPIDGLRFDPGAEP